MVSATMGGGGGANDLSPPQNIDFYLPSSKFLLAFRVYNLHVAPRASLKQQSNEEESPNARARSDPLPSSVAVQPFVPF
ncbi:hypothetical protein L1987_72658 [Smallanthus sonchifolius]|uniref:Uncharacterized protein n=1 Tax=Smallanthus sonchifolius TaxID=185202 RepID=A0ACB9AWJ7_9ASTR|nr:hypothetical protein L1987_72658 [Smallanthus sonchifolius]